MTTIYCICILYIYEQHLFFLNRGQFIKIFKNWPLKTHLVVVSIEVLIVNALNPCVSSSLTQERFYYNICHFHPLYVRCTMLWNNFFLFHQYNFDFSHGKEACLTVIPTWLCLTIIPSWLNFKVTWTFLTGLVAALILCSPKRAAIELIC